MFRELLRKNKRLDTDTCIRLLREQKRGVLSVIGDHGYPYGMPMNHFYNDDDGCIYFHCGRVGHRLDSLKRCDKASFCVYDEGYREGDSWALNIKSVIVFGRVEMIDDIDEVRDIADRLCRKFTDDDVYIQSEIAAHAKNTLLLKLAPDHITGKLVNEA